MILVDDLIIGILSSTIVAYVDRLDDAIDDEQKEHLEELKRRVEVLRNWDSPGEQAATLIKEALRDHHQPGSPAPALVKIVPQDPLWGMELTQWLLEPDPKQFAAQQDSLAARLAKASDCEESAVAEFLTRVSRRIDHHLGLSQLRAEKKLNLILERLRCFEELSDIVERNQFTFLAAFRKWLTDEQRKLLIPVCPVARARTEDNSLLSGSRPTDNDMHENLDFERFVFKDVIAAIKATESFPCVFLFKADPQKGKTTFLKRVGWHLAQHRYPVLRLAEGGQAEPYAHWISTCAAEQESLPLIVLIDDPAKQKEHFTNQLEDLRQRGSQVIILLASQSLDWKQVNEDQCPLISQRHMSTRTFELNPRRGEERCLVDKLVSRGLLGVDRYDEIIKEVEQIPFGDGYFHRVIQAATDERNRPISAMVEEALREAAGSSDADAFERFYAMVCVPGMLGLPLPERVAQIVFPDDADRTRALAFNDRLPRPAIRISDPYYSVRHETYAADFLAPRDLVAQTRSFVRAFVAHPELGDYVGRLLNVQRMRGDTEMTAALWDEIADQVTDDHWRACSAEALTGNWGSLLFELGRIHPSLSANAIAVEMAPENAIAHNNYALLLNERNEPQAARMHYEEALRINQEDAETHSNYGNLLRKLQEPEAAREHHEEALRINPESAGVHNNYALLLTELTEQQAAQTHFERALSINPENAAAHNNFGVLLRQLKDPQTAQAHYEEALRINPNQAGVHCNYAVLLLVDLKDLQAARAHFKEALRINPEDAATHYSYATLLEDLEEPLAAQVHYEEALRINPEDAAAHNNYALLLQELQEPQAAQTHYEEALRINPEYAAAHINYASLLEELEDPQAARTHYEKALRIDPENAAMHANNASFLLDQGKLQLSLDRAVRAIRLRTLPDGRTRIPGWFSDHVDDLLQIVESPDATPERRGGALAFLIALKDERVLGLVHQWEEEAGLAPAAEVCNEILEAWKEATKQDTKEPPPVDTSAE